MPARIASATVVAVLVLLIAAACGGDEAQPRPTAIASPTATYTATATPEVIDGVEVLPLQFDEEMELPKDIALIIETGCYYCDGPTTGLYRLYQNAGGQLRADALFTVEALGLPPIGVAHYKDGDQPIQPFIHSYALSTDASEIVVSVCTRGECAWLGFATPDAQATLYRSLDGGATWEKFGVLDGESWVVAIARDGAVVAGPYGSEPESQPKYRLFPSGEPVQPPSGANWWPLTLPGGELAWPAQDGRVLHSDGSEVLTLDGAAYVGDIVADASGERLAVAWYVDLPSPRHLIGAFSRDGRPMSAFSFSGSARVGGWLNDTLVAGNAGVPSELLPTPRSAYAINFVPVIFDLESGEARPLAGPFHELPLFGRNYVRAVLHGPFARVVNTGACLNVRAEPDMAATVLACTADGVLLRDTGETREVDGAAWRRVETPAGVEGWASSQFLER